LKQEEVSPMNTYPVLAAALLTASVAGCANNGVRLSNGGSERTFTKQITLASGQPNHGDIFGSLNPDCTAVPGVSARVTVQPSHGKVTARPTQDFVYFKEPNPRAKCNTKRVPAWIVQYRSDPGYVGSDTYSYDKFLADGVVYHVTINVDVR
jgi:hypothetical protein